MIDVSGNESLAEIVCRPCAVDELLPLRALVLRPGYLPAQARFHGDDDPASIHLGAFRKDECVACVTLIPSKWDGDPAWQLRGLATHLAYRRRGIASRLMAMAEEAVRASGGPRFLWCNSRIESVSFYENRGWRVVSEEFLIEGIGSHYKMLR